MENGRGWSGKSGRAREERRKSQEGRSETSERVVWGWEWRQQRRQRRQWRQWRQWRRDQVARGVAGSCPSWGTTPTRTRSRWINTPLRGSVLLGVCGSRRRSLGHAGSASAPLAISLLRREEAARKPRSASPRKTPYDVLLFVSLPLACPLFFLRITIIEFPFHPLYPLTSHLSHFNPTSLISKRRSFIVSVIEKSSQTNFYRK